MVGSTENLNLDSAAPHSTFEKSRTRYENRYKKFKTWLEEENLTISEDSVLKYFQEKSAFYRSQSSYNVEYFALKATILLMDGIDISEYKNVSEFVKTKKSQDPPKVSKTFTREEVNRFLLEAPDHDYLLLKVVMIIGIAGGCRRDELTNMSIDDIIDKGSVMLISVPGSNERTFTIIDNPASEVQYVPYVRKYLDLRPENTTTRRLFYTMRKGCCINQVVGINTIAQFPCKIAEYLQLENPRGYTGNAFRRTYLSFKHNTILHNIFSY